MLLSEGQMSDHKGARLLLPRLPAAKELLADRGYDSNRLRAELEKRGTTPCIPPPRTAKSSYPTTRSCIASVTASRTSSAASRTGAVSPHATTAAPIPSSRQFASQLPSFSGCRNEA